VKHIPFNYHFAMKSIHGEDIRAIAHKRTVSAPIRNWFKDHKRGRYRVSIPINHRQEVDVFIDDPTTATLFKLYWSEDISS